MTSGPDGGLYVAIPDGKTHVLALLGADGATRAGWPIRVSSPWCPRIISGEDGSVRLLCDPPTEGDDGLQEAKVRVFGFDARGRTLSGWPIDVPGDAWRPSARMVGPDLAMLIRPYMGDSVPEDTPEQIQLGLIDSRGGLQLGTVVEHDCCQADYAIGPDGTGYIVQTEWSESATRTNVVAFRLEGRFASWPVTIEGYGSSLAFDDEGRIYLAVGDGGLRESGIVVIDRGGQVLLV
ncbi:MAG TPA: hypothetical protein VFO73_08425, partial [Candidatus Limnocylindrales bacterium]|nr:hypothetical protein [Candidatus Limnocylindrales bacterium]